MIFLDTLPDTVEVEGEHYPVYTDFRDWIRFDGLIRDPAVSGKERAVLLLDWYSGALPPPGPKVYEALFHFYLCGEPPLEERSRQSKEVFDFRQDMPMVHAGFVQSYGVNLLRVPHLHWWEFRALLDGLPENTKLSKVIGYRAVDLSKLPKSERPRYRELQRLYALKQTGGSSPRTIEDRDQELIRRAEEARRRAEGDGVV